jgi:hypothetical protein
MAFFSRIMQWSRTAPLKAKGSKIHVSDWTGGLELQQKTANFKVAIGSSLMQWSAPTEGEQKNQLAQTDFRFIK